MAEGDGEGGVREGGLQRPEWNSARESVAEECKEMVLHLFIASYAFLG